MTIEDVTGRLARWSLFMQQFDFDIKHRPGGMVENTSTGYTGTGIGYTNTKFRHLVNRG